MSGDSNRLPAVSDDPSTPTGTWGRISRGLAAGIGGVGVSLIIQVASVPILLGAWGLETYGEWLILSAVPTYIALSDVSFATVAGNSMVMMEARGRRTEAIALGRQMWTIVSATTSVAVLSAIAIGWLLADARDASSAISVNEVQIVLVALFLQVGLDRQFGILDAWFRTAGRYPLGVGLYQVSRLLSFVLLATVAWFGASPATGAVALLSGTAVGLACAWLVVHRAVPWATFKLARPDRATVRHLLAPGLAFMALPIGNALSVQGLTLVVGVVLGPVAVVAFATTRTMTRVVVLAVGAVGSAVWPEISRTVGRGSLDESRAIMRRATQLSLAISLTLAATLLAFGDPMIRWWTGGAVDPNRGLLVLLVVVVVANSVWSIPAAVLAATNRHKRMAATYLIGSGLSLLVAVPMTATFGTVGAAASLIVVDVLVVAHALPAALRIVDDTLRSFLRAVINISWALRWARAGLGGT